MNISSIIKKKDYVVLELLICKECFSSYGALSTPDIIEETGLSHVKIGQVVKNFTMFGLISEGSKDGKKKTYYINENGIQHYKQQLQYEEKDIDEMIENYNKELEEKKLKEENKNVIK